MYGQLIENVLIEAPKVLTVDGLVHYHPSAELYIGQGYKEVVDTPYPEVSEEDTGYYIATYEEQDGKIVKAWAEVTPTEVIAPTPSIEDRVTSLENELSLTQEAVDFLIMGSGV